MAHELITAARAAHWYRQAESDQYGTERVAEGYDTAARMLTDREHFAEELVGRIGEPIGTGLEIAAGTGIVSEALAKHFPNIIHTDLEAPPLHILRKRLGGTAAIAQADFCDLPFDDKSFSTVVGVGCYRYVTPKNRDRFWGEMHRVLEPGGRAFIGQFYPRGFRIEGSDIAQDVRTVMSEDEFALHATWETVARARVGRMNVRSGIYRTFELHRA